MQEGDVFPLNSREVAVGTVKPSPINSRRSKRPTERANVGNIDPGGVAYRHYWGTPFFPLPCLLSAGRTDPRLLRGDRVVVVERSVVLGIISA